jgi:hypothetical protein
MPTNPCGQPTNHPEQSGTYNYDPNVDDPKLIDPDTGTTEPWKSYIGRWRALDQRILKALRTAFTRKNPARWSDMKLEARAEEMYAWGQEYMIAEYGPYRTGCRPCGTPQDSFNYPKEGINLHALWDAEKPLWYEDEWETDEVRMLWAEYDGMYDAAVLMGIIKA